MTLKVSPLELYAGLDVHMKNTVGTIKDERGNTVCERVVPTTSEGFRQLFARFKKARVVAVFEASRNWSYVARLIREQGVEPVMAHPLKVRAIASARIKTDTIDSRTLADLLRAGLIPRSYMPSDGVVRARRLVRYRAHLGRLSARLKCRARSILALEGIVDKKDLFGPRSRSWLTNVNLEEQNRGELNYAVKLLDSVKKEMEGVERSIEKECMKYSGVDLLTTIPGIGPYSALMILSEIGDVNRFPTAEKLAAYSGLIPSTYQSGARCYQGRITKQGSRWLRWILVECALVCIRKPTRLQRFYHRVERRKGHPKAIVATARKMLMIIWHLLVKQEVFVP